MSTTSSTAAGSASRWAPLWGSRPADWALSEEMQRPTYEAALERTGLEPDWRVLDIGCGAGAFLRLIAESGCQPSGVDASEALIGLARARVPAADLRVGEMEELPWNDLSQSGLLQKLALQAQLAPEDEFDAAWAFAYPDAESLGRAM